MISFFHKARRQLRRFVRRDDGTASIEIVIILPVFMFFFMSAYEGGMVSMRHMMMERGLDLAVRDVRIGRLLDPTHEELKTRICKYSSIIPDCNEQLQLEMVVMDINNWGTQLDGAIKCIDRALTVQPAVQFTHGDNNELMVLQVCTLFDPVVPTSGLGKYIPKKSGGAYALVASSAFVMEPFR